MPERRDAKVAMTPEEFRAALERLGWTNADAGHNLGVHEITVSKYRTGGLPIDTRTALALQALEKLHGGRLPGLMSADSSETFIYRGHRVVIPKAKDPLFDNLRYALETAGAKKRKD
jgi:hypothetical protein